MGDSARRSAAAEHTPAAQDGAGPARLLAAIVQSSDDAILSKDLDGTITSWNRGAERIYGYSADEVIGRPVSLLVPPEIENDTLELLARLRRGERVERYETRRMARDGRRLVVSLTVSPLFDDQGRVVGASTIARDITERRLEETRWRLLSDVGQALARQLEPEPLLTELARLLVQESADYCVTYLLEGSRIRRVAATHADPEQTALVGRLVELAPPTLDDELGAGAAIRTGEPFLVSDVSRELLERAASGEHLQVLTALGPVSSMVIPLRARQRTLGALALATTARSKRRYGPADLVLCRELADRAALALDNTRVYGEARSELRRREEAEELLRRRYGQLRVLYDMTEAVGRAGEVDEVFDQGLEGLRQGLQVQRAAVLLFDPDGVMRFRAWRGISEEYRRAVEGHTPWPRDARDPQPVVIADVAGSGELDEALRATVLAEGIRSMAFVPLVFSGTLLGKFMLYRDEAGPFAPDELSLAVTVAGTIAFAITRVRDEHALREARETAERANQAKSQFLGIMSHELRTPLNAVLGYSELLLMETKGPLNDEQRSQLARIQASASHQLDLVEEILAYTRLEAGREEPRALETDARRVVREVAELIRPETEARRLQLRVELPDAPLQLVTDPAKLRQIVLNLAGNAAKYTARGEVVLRAAAEGEWCRFEVADTGPGIAADQLEYIFEPFARVDESLTRGTAGTGLGLAIARRLAGILGGSVEVRSEVGRGSSFSLTLPARIPGTAETHRYPLPG